MVTVAEPNPSKKILTAGAMSPMRFMAEYLVHDSEVSSLVRFRGPFIEPDWTGVTDDESDYVVDSNHMKLWQIAAEMWGDGKEELMWVIAARNSLDLPDVQLYQGRRLKIPSLDWVESTLLRQAISLVAQQ